MQEGGRDVADEGFGSGRERIVKGAGGCTPENSHTRPFSIDPLHTIPSWQRNTTPTSPFANPHQLLPPTASNRIIPNRPLPNRLIPNNVFLQRSLNHLEHSHIMVLQVRRSRRPRPSPPAVQLSPRERPLSKTRDVREVDRQRLGAVRCHQTHDDTIRERAGEELVQLAGYRTRLAGGGECCGGPAWRVLVDGEDALCMSVPCLDLG